MNQIKTIEELISAFDLARPSDRGGVLKRTQIPAEEFEQYATWREGGYTRNCVIRKEGFEFILLCWDKGAATPIHGHADQDCWVYQVSGELTEKRYKMKEGRLALSNEMDLTEGCLAYMHDRMGFHTIENGSKQRAMTLHVYASPIDECSVFNKDLDKFEIVTMQYDSIHGK